MNVSQTETKAVCAKMPKRQFLSPTILSVLKERKKRKLGWLKSNCDKSKQMTSKDNLQNFKKQVKNLR